MKKRKKKNPQNISPKSVCIPAAYQDFHLMFFHSWNMCCQCQMAQFLREKLALA